MELGPVEEAKRQKRFQKLDELAPEFRQTLEGKTKEELDNKLAEIAKLEQANRDALLADETVAKLREELKGAKEVYGLDSKTHKLMTEWVVNLMESKGFA